MTYEVQDKVKELAEITGTTPEATAKKYGLDYKRDTYILAWNRGEQNRIHMALEDAKAAQRAQKAKAAFEQKLASGAIVWRKVGYEWLVQVTGREVAEGDMLDVTRRNGETSKQLVRKIVSRGVDGIFCRV